MTTFANTYCTCGCQTFIGSEMYKCVACGAVWSEDEMDDLVYEGDD